MKKKGRFWTIFKNKYMIIFMVCILFFSVTLTVFSSMSIKSYQTNEEFIVDLNSYIDDILEEKEIDVSTIRREFDYVTSDSKIVNQFLEYEGETGRCSAIITYDSEKKKNKVISLASIPSQGEFNIPDSCSGNISYIFGAISGTDLVNRKISVKSVNEYIEKLQKDETYEEIIEIETENYIDYQIFNNEQIGKARVTYTSSLFQIYVEDNKYRDIRIIQNSFLEDKTVPFKVVYEDMIPEPTTGKIISEEKKQDGIDGRKEEARITLTQNNNKIYFFEESNIFSELKDEIVIRNYESLIFDETMFPKVAYSEILRSPLKYKGTYAQFEGEIVQSLGNDTYHVNVTQTGAYIDIFTDRMQISDVHERYIEGDIVKFYVELDGVLTYETILGGSNEIPKAKALKAEFLYYKS